MTKVDIAGGARRDLVEILGLSFDRWGEKGKARYESLLEAVIQTLAVDPEHLMSRACSELAPGLRSFHLRHLARDHGVKSPVHVVYYYRKTRSTIVIVRILHERMAPEVQLAAPPSRRPHRR